MIEDLSDDQISDRSPKTLEELCTLIGSYYEGADLSLIRRSYEFSELAHSGQIRRSGEPATPVMRFVLDHTALDHKGLALRRGWSACAATGLIGPGRHRHRSADAPTGQAAGSFATAWSTPADHGQAGEEWHAGTTPVPLLITESPQHDGLTIAHKDLGAGLPR